MNIPKTHTMIATLIDIQPETSKSRRFMRLQGRTGGLQYSDRLEFMVLDADGRREDGFLSSELVGVKKGEGNEMIFETQNSTYRFQVLF